MHTFVIFPKWVLEKVTVSHQGIWETHLRLALLMIIPQQISSRCYSMSGLYVHSCSCFSFSHFMSNWAISVVILIRHMARGGNRGNIKWSFMGVRVWFYLAKRPVAFRVSAQRIPCGHHGAITRYASVPRQYKISIIRIREKYI